MIVMDESKEASRVVAACGSILVVYSIQVDAAGEVSQGCNAML
jgi:hypothetical protein